MALFIAENYTRPLKVQQVADSVGLNPIYAARLFRKTFGVSLKSHITEQRVSYAQRLRAAGVAVEEHTLPAPTSWPCALSNPASADAPWTTALQGLFTKFFGRTLEALRRLHPIQA